MIRTLPLSLFTGLYVVAIVAIANAETPVTCSASALTRACKFFEERATEPMISLPDGTAFKNPVGVKPAPASAPSSNDDGTRFEKSLRARVRAIRSWDAMPDDQKVSDAFRMSVETQLENGILAEAFGEKVEAGGPAFLNASPTLAWPADKKDASPRRVAKKELEDFVATLPEKVRTEMLEAIRIARESSVPIAEPAATIVTSNPERLKRLQELAEFARASLINEITGTRSLEQLSLEERAQIEKLRTIRIRPGDEVASHPQCAGVEPDSINNPITHSIGLCPNFANYPDSQLVFIFAHEMSHAIDPCYRAFPLLRIDRDKIAKLTPSELPNEIRDDPDRLKIFNQLKSLPAGVELSNFEALFVLKSPASLDYFVEKNFVSVLAPAITEARDPSGAAYSCLQAKGTFRETKHADVVAFAAAYADALDEKSRDGMDKAATRANIETALNRYPQCAPTLVGGSQMGEVMADAWGAKALGRWLAIHPPKNELDKIAAVATFAADSCSPNLTLPSAAESTEVRTPRALRERIGAFSGETHPPARDRINAIVLTEPRLQNAMQCRSASPTTSCIQFLGGSRSSSRGPTPSTSGGTVR